MKAGELRRLVATASLELGIDVGTIDLVLQIDSPKSAAAGIQRIGRAGHAVGGESRGCIIARGPRPVAGVRRAGPAHCGPLDRGGPHSAACARCAVPADGRHGRFRRLDGGRAAGGVRAQLCLPRVPAGAAGSGARGIVRVLPVRPAPDRLGPFQRTVDPAQRNADGRHHGRRHNPAEQRLPGASRGQPDSSRRAGRGVYP
ncbi:hypothetical protein LJK88_10340 [Paenibacillus sp. P26]|nr:hypothetical protein LJK88_10340 [Paenibacillus sp. P26]